MKRDSGEGISRYISSVGRPVTPQDVDTYDRLSQIEAWTEEERGQRRLRIIYGTTILALLSVQVIAITVFVFLIGLGTITIDRWVTTTFIGGTLAEVSSMIFLIVRYLFPVLDSKQDHD